MTHILSSFLPKKGRAFSGSLAVDFQEKGQRKKWGCLVAEKMSRDWDRGEEETKSRKSEPIGLGQDIPQKYRTVGEIVKYSFVHWVVTNL